MDDKQAAAVLRQMQWAAFTHGGEHGSRRAEVCKRGADAIEFKAWLFEPNQRGVLRMFTLWYGWHQQGDFLDFPTYCEAKFEESKAPSKTPRESTT